MSRTDLVNDNYVRAGQISRDVRNSVEARDWRGKSYLEICEYVEAEIRRMGAAPAFPCNICCNESAAHYTAEIEDSRVIAEEALVKVDIGVHVDGYVADTAVTICYSDDLLDLADATKSALGEALKAIKIGARVSDVGRAVESYASRRGYVPIQNLSGHSLDVYEVHAGTSIPNVWSSSPSAFRQDKVYAIEPFLTTSDGSGIVIEGRSQNIFSLVARKKTKDNKLDGFLESVWNKCKSLPFAARWFSDEYKKEEMSRMIGQLLKMRLLHSYPELIEARDRPVAQAEHTVAPTPSGLVVLT